MDIEFASFAVGVVTGSLMAIALAIPRIGRTLSQCVAVVGLISGIALLATGIVSLATRNSFSTIRLASLRISEPVEAIGLGGGLVLGCVLVIVLTMLRARRHSPSGQMGP